VFFKICTGRVLWGMESRCGPKPLHVCREERTGEWFYSKVKRHLLVWLTTPAVYDSSCLQILKPWAMSNEGRERFLCFTCTGIERWAVVFRLITISIQRTVPFYLLFFCFPLPSIDFIRVGFRVCISKLPFRVMFTVYNIL
jgi:hypothetical protein